MNVINSRRARTETGGRRGFGPLMSRTGVADGRLQVANVLTILRHVGSQKCHVTKKKVVGVGRGRIREGIAPRSRQSILAQAGSKAGDE